MSKVKKTDISYSDTKTVVQIILRYNDHNVRNVKVDFFPNRGITLEPHVHVCLFLLMFVSHKERKYKISNPKYQWLLIM